MTDSIPCKDYKWARILELEAENERLEQEIAELRTRFLDTRHKLLAAEKELGAGPADGALSGHDHYAPRGDWSPNHEDPEQ